MKSFLSSLRKLDSSTDVLRDRIASNQQFQLFSSLSQASSAIDRSIRKGLPGISLSLHTSLLKIGTSFALLTGMLGYSAAPALAEGSRTMYPNGALGNRANLHQNTTTQLLGGKLKGRTLFKVYVNAGEYINVGSSAVGVNLGDIRIFNPGVVTGTLGQETLPTTASFQCSTQRASIGNPNIRPTVGVINSREKELAGPDTITNPVTAARGNDISTGYVPCYYQAPQTGVYDVYFVPPTPADASATIPGEVSLASPDNFTISQSNTVAAWDVTVRSSLTSTSNEDSRLFVYYAYLRHHGNSRYAYFSLYPVTLDGFQYRTNLNGIDPNSWSSFGNRLGFLDSDGVTPLYHDILGSDDALATITGGASVQLPQFPMFFNPPNSTVVSALGIPTAPIKPEVTAFSFAGSVASNNSLVGVGGTFTFAANVDHSYEIVISRDGVNFDPTNVNNRVLRGLKSLGTNTVTWNGKDNAGVNFPVGTNYQSKIVIRNGEYHFPMADVENSLGGPSITMLNPPGGVCPGNNCATAFYDDRGYKLLDGTIVGKTVNAALTNAPATSFSGSSGFTSTTNQRAFSANFGDRKGLDIWTYFPSEAASTLLSILSVDYGDAPASYGNASHNLPTTPTVYLGSTVPDSEAGTQLGSNAGATAQGDDTNGVDDENGISSFPPANPGATTYSIPAANITARGTGTLHAWIDFDQNGTFESNEHTSVAVTSNTLAGALTWPTITTIAAGKTFARFRFTNDATVTASTPSGFATDGEVEDYSAVLVFPPISSCDASIYTVNVPSTGGGIQKLMGLSPSSSYTPTTLATTGFPFANIYSLVKAGDNNLYYATADSNPGTSFVYKFDVTTNTSSATTWQLPAPGIDGYWISGSTDPAGMLYFLSGRGNKLVKVNPYTNTVTTVWSTAPTTTVKSPANTSFGTNYVDIGFDLDGNAFFIDNNSKYIWKVTDVNGTPTAKYLGTITGGTATQLSDIVWHKDSNGIPRLYVVGNNGVYIVDPSTYVATFVPGSSTHYYDIAGCRDFGIVRDGLSISGTVFNDTDSSKIQNGTEAGTNGGGLNAVLLNSSNAVVATTTVAANGTYSFSNVAPATYKVLITTGTTATITLPTNQVSTGENLNNTLDATVDSTLTVVVGSSNITGANFGIKQSVIASPNLLLVKRITAINGNTTNGNISLNSYDYETTTTNSSYHYDKNVIQPNLTPPNSDKWPNTSGNPLSSTFLLGARNGGTTKPNDTVEYTIYFLSAGDSEAKKVLLCDRVPPNVTFIPNAFNSGTADPSGLSTADRGIAIRLGNTLKSYTNINDNDIARYYPPGSEPIADFPKINCGGSNTNGAVVVNLGTRQKATGIAADDAAAGAFGFIRFRGQVK